MKKFLSIFIPLVIAVAAIGGYLWYRNNQARGGQQAANVQFITVTKGTLSSSISATGNVVTAQSASLTWKTSGRVAKVDVKVGDAVRPDQVLASLAAESLSQSMVQARANLITAQTNLDNLKKVDPVAQANAQKAVADAQNSLEAANNAKSYLKYKYGPDQIAAAQAQVVILQDTLAQLNANLIYVSDRPNSKTNYIKALSDIAGVEASLRLAQDNLARLQGAEPSRELRDADAALAVAQAQLQAASDNLSQLQAGPKASDLQAAQAKIAAIQAQLAQQYMTAPFAGTVTRIDILPGDLVSSGKVAFRIDVVSPLLVDLQVSELDINAVKVGQPAHLTFDGVPNKTYAGAVTAVSSVGRTSGGLVNFEVTVQMQDADVSVRPGMSATAEIVTSQLDDVLLVPVRAVHITNNQAEVFVQDSTGTHAVPVQVGESNDGSTQIVSGVKEGDRLVVTPPASTIGTQTAGFGGFGIFRGGPAAGDGGFRPGD
jgi:HlyD family secretion protein